MYSLKQIHNAVDNITAFDGNKEEVKEQLATAITALKDALCEMETLKVSGRFNVDTLLGCMMAVEQIIGEGENNG